MLYPTELRGHIMKWLREIATGAGALAMTLSDTLTEKRPRNETKRSLRGRLSAAPASSNEVRARRRGHAPALRILQKYLREIATGASALAMTLIPAQWRRKAVRKRSRPGGRSRRGFRPSPGSARPSCRRRTGRGSLSRARAGTPRSRAAWQGCRAGSACSGRRRHRRPSSSRRRWRRR